VRRIAKFVAIGLAVVVGVVAAFFGALVFGAILVVAALLALLGRGKFTANLNRAPRRSPVAGSSAPPPAAGDVIDIEARKVETPPELK
jgi:hypothetical protein